MNFAQMILILSFFLNAQPVVTFVTHCYLYNIVQARLSAKMGRKMKCALQLKLHTATIVLRNKISVQSSNHLTTTMWSTLLFNVMTAYRNTYETTFCLHDLMQNNYFILGIGFTRSIWTNAVSGVVRTVWKICGKY